MKKDTKHLKWHLLFLLTISLLIGGIYIASQKINYDWQWSRVMPYIVNTAPIDITAKADGAIEINADGDLVITYDNLDSSERFSGLEEILVSDGDLIFEGDIVAHKEHVGMGLLIKGLITTLELSVISLIFSLVIGLATALMRIAKNPLAKNFAILYIEIIRGTPLLVQIFIVYFFIGTVFDLSRFVAGIIALSLFSGAYVAEIIRSGIQSIPPGQMEAARSLGMTYSKAMIYVILPQAFKSTLPPLAGQLINLIKDSSLVSVISITDLTKAGREVISGNFATFEVWFTVAALYFLLTAIVSWGIRRLEKRLSAND